MVVEAISIPVDGARIAGTLFAAARTGTAQPIVVCAHGLTGSRAGSCYRFVRLGRILAERGIACLTFDFRGCGESGGEFVDVTCDRLQADLRRVIDWVRSRTDLNADRMGICGSSFGAFTTSRVAPDIAGLKALAYWAPVARPRLLFASAMTDAAWGLLDRQGWLDHRGMPLGRRFFEISAEDGDGPAALAACSAPLLMFHSSGDREVPIEHSRLYESALRNRGIEARLEVLELSDHGMRDVVANERIIRRTAEWFEQWL